MGGPGSGKSRKPITRNRPKTRLFCRFKPRRTQPRVVTTKVAARFICAAIANGATLRQILARKETVCPDKEPARDLNAEGTIAQAAQEVESMVETMDGALSEAYQLFIAINGIIGVILAALALFARNPLLRVISRRAVALTTPIAVIETRIIGAQAAANDARFLLQVIRSRVLRAA